MTAVYTLTRLGLNQPLTDEVQRLLERPPTAMASFLQQTAWRFQTHNWT